MKLQTILITAFLSLILAQCKCTGQINEANITGNKAMVLETQDNITVGQIHFNTWVAGVKQGGSGINIYFPNLVNKKNNTLQSVYFRGLKGQIINGKSSYFAKLKRPNTDLNMSSEKHGEYGNTLPEVPVVFPFTLEDNECVISYLDNGKTKYIKFENIIEKESVYFPSAPPRNKRP